MKPKIALGIESLLTIRTVYLKDIEFLNKNRTKDNEELFKDYLIHLENEVNEINLELVERGYCNE